VNLKKLTKQMQREAKANPGKAVFLGLLAVVALWFWLPLVWGWIGKEDPTTAEAAVETFDTNTAATLNQESTTPGETEASHYPWHEIAKWMDNDPLTSAANMIKLRRDPFRPHSSQSSQEAIDDEPEELLPDVTPESLGIVLSGTIIGPDRRVALINGKPYDEAKPVRFLKDGQKIEFTIEQIHPRRIVLQRNEEQFELRTQPSALSERIQRID